MPGDVWKRDLRSQIMTETKWPLDPEKLVAAFNELVASFRATVIANLRLESELEKVQQLDSKLNELKQLVEQDADKWVTGRGSLTQVKFIFEVAKEYPEFVMVIDDLDDRCIQYLQTQVRGLRSIHDYEETPEGWKLKENK